MDLQLLTGAVPAAGHHRRQVLKHRGVKQHCERESVKGLTPADVIKSLPNIKPLDEGAIFQETAKKGSYEFRGMSIDSLPQIDWYQLYNITGVRDKKAQTPMPGRSELTNIFESTVPPPPPAV